MILRHINPAMSSLVMRRAGGEMSMVVVYND